MKYALALLPLYLSCSWPEAQTPAQKAIVVNLDQRTRNAPEEEEEQLGEIPVQRAVKFVTDSFRQILREQDRQTLEGTVYFERSDHLFHYHYEPLPFCEADSGARYEGKITFEYHSSEQVEKKTMSTIITLTDVFPFGPVDNVKLSIDGTARLPFYGNYQPNQQAQQLHEVLFRELSQEVEKHQLHYRSFDNFDLMRVAKDNWQNYKVHHQLLHGLLAQEPLPWEKLRIFNPCEL
ncbi:hypothetical protein HYU08_00850 [Candidatus Woesearchaeota archaeon]|nr:hypothetical protein [Candidatus Woesearchaeota archaeon]